MGGKEYQTEEYQVRYRGNKSDFLVLFNETDDEAVAREWANRLWKLGSCEVVILTVEKKILARKVR